MRKKYGVFGTGYEMQANLINYGHNFFLESFDTEEETEAFIKNKPSNFKVYSVVTVYID